MNEPIEIRIGNFIGYATLEDGGITLRLPNAPMNERLLRSFLNEDPSIRVLEKR